MRCVELIANLADEVALRSQAPAIDQVRLCLVSGGKFAERVPKERRVRLEREVCRVVILAGARGSTARARRDGCAAGRVDQT